MEDINKEEIYEEYHLKVLRYINSQVNDYHLAEDLCSDVFLKVYEKLDTYNKSKAQFSTWIFTITRNRLIDYYRTRKQVVEIPETLAIEQDDEELFTPEQLANLANALKQLDDRKKYLIVAHYYENTSLKDIAEKLDISYAYVKILHKSALKELKNYLN